MWVIFGQVETDLADKYDIKNDPIDRIRLYMVAWRGNSMRGMGAWVHPYLGDNPS